MLLCIVLTNNYIIMDKNKELQDWFDNLTLEEFLEQTETPDDSNIVGHGLV